MHSFQSYETIFTWPTAYFLGFVCPVLLLRCYVAFCHKKRWTHHRRVHAHTFVMATSPSFVPSICRIIALIYILSSIRRPMSYHDKESIAYPLQHKLVWHNLVWHILFWNWSLPGMTKNAIYTQILRRPPFSQQPGYYSFHSILERSPGRGHLYSHICWFCLCILIHSWGFFRYFSFRRVLPQKP